VTTAPTARSPAGRREWTPHFWVGCDAFSLSRLLVRHRFRVHWSKWYVVAVASFVAGVHTALSLLQSAVFGRRVSKTKIDKAPLFIIGHWRSGTTLLHELLIRDPRHAFPSTYECLVPHHFLVTRPWGPKLLWWMMPSRRPMDNMPAGWDRPQEDEFALCLLGQPSPYERIAFPNESEETPRLPSAERRWPAAFLRFVREVTLLNGGRRLILKSPPHTWRIPTLLRLFPQARFLHIVRNPYVVLPSTVNLWNSLYLQHSLQTPPFAGLRERVLDTFVEMHERLDKTRSLLPPGQYCELRYEDLLRDPIGRLEALYRDLGLGDFESARKHAEAYVAGMKSYETNRYDLTPADREAVASRWGAIARRYGYEPPPG
jgi:hypothetical protein